MPRGDGTGPMGMGPMTGRAAGYCTGSGVPGFANPVPRQGLGFRRGYGSFARGAGFGRGGGFGRGFSRGFNYAGRGGGFRGRGATYAPVNYRAPAYGQLPKARDWFAQRAGTQTPTQAPQTQPVPQPSFSAAPQPIQQPQTSKEQEIQTLENQVRALEDQIGQIRDRIKQLRE